MERKKLTKSKAYYITQIIGGIVIVILLYVIILATKSSSIHHPTMFLCLCGIARSFFHVYLYYILIIGCRGISFNSQELSYNYKGEKILVPLNKVRDFEVQGKALFIVLSEVSTGDRIITGMLENKTIINEFIEYRKHAIEKYGIADDLPSVL